MLKKLIILLSFLLILIILSTGCYRNDDKLVTINLLYSSPVHINNTTVYFDGDLILQFKNYSLDTYPPYLGRKNIELDNGKYEIIVIDTNFNLTRTKTIDVDKRLFVDIIISNDNIDIDISEKQTEYK